MQVKIRKPNVITTYVQMHNISIAIFYFLWSKIPEFFYKFLFFIWSNLFNQKFQIEICKRFGIDGKIISLLEISNDRVVQLCIGSNLNKRDQSNRDIHLKDWKNENSVFSRTFTGYCRINQISEIYFLSTCHKFRKSRILLASRDATKIITLGRSSRN